jgi:hypothetical protein
MPQSIYCHSQTKSISKGSKELTVAGLIGSDNKHSLFKMSFIDMAYPEISDTVTT